MLDFLQHFWLIFIYFLIIGISPEKLGMIQNMFHCDLLLFFVGLSQASQVVLVVENLPVNSGDIRDLALIPESGRTPGGGNDNPLQYSCLENSIDRSA